MPKYEFALDSERSFYEVEAATEAEARKLLFDNPGDYYTGCHHDTMDDENSYELIYVTEDEGLVAAADGSEINAALAPGGE